MTVSIEHQADLADGYERESVYVEMQDGCRIAVESPTTLRGVQQRLQHQPSNTCRRVLRVMVWTSRLPSWGPRGPAGTAPDSRTPNSPPQERCCSAKASSLPEEARKCSSTSSRNGFWVCRIELKPRPRWQWLAVAIRPDKQEK